MWEVDRLRKEYAGLSEGVRRLWIATSTVWLVAYLVLNWSDFALLWHGALATPSTTCAQVYLQNDNREGACEFAAAPFSEGISFYAERKSHSFSPYFKKYRRDDKLFIWLGAPVAWLILLWLGVWVKRGFKK
jgi:hypothetical protein